MSSRHGASSDDDDLFNLESDMVDEAFSETEPPARATRGQAGRGASGSAIPDRGADVMADLDQGQSRDMVRRQGWTSAMLSIALVGSIAAIIALTAMMLRERSNQTSMSLADSPQVQQQMNLLEGRIRQAVGDAEARVLNVLPSLDAMLRQHDLQIKRLQNSQSQIATRVESIANSVNKLNNQIGQLRRQRGAVEAAAIREAVSPRAASAPQSIRRQLAEIRSSGDRKVTGSTRATTARSEEPARPVTLDPLAFGAPRLDDARLGRASANAPTIPVPTVTRPTATRPAASPQTARVASEAPQRTAPPPRDSSAGDTFIYMTNAGDTIRDIAELHGAPIDLVLQLNSIGPADAERPIKGGVPIRVPR